MHSLEKTLTSKKNRPWVALGIILILLFAYMQSSRSQITGASVLQPGAEGPQVQLLGFQPPNTNTIYAAGDSSIRDYDGAVSDSYAWAATTEIGITQAGNPCSAANPPETTASVTLSVPQTATSNSGWLGSGLDLAGSPYSQTISYWNTLTNGTRAHTTGVVYADQFNIEYKANGSPQVTFDAGSLWYELWVNVWSVQMCDPTNTTTCQSGTVWGSPLETVISQLQTIGLTSGGTSNSPNNDQINPMSQGSSFTLYNGVTTSAPTGVPITPTTDPSQVVGGSQLAPDQSMSQYTEFPIAFTNFGPYGCGALNTNTCYPDVTLTVTVYYLVVGTFLWSNPNTTPYNPSPQGPSGCTVQSGCDWAGMISQWLANPFNLFGLGVFGTVLFFGAVFIIAVVVMGRVPTIRRNNNK